MPTIAAMQTSASFARLVCVRGGSALFRGALAFRRSAAALARANASPLAQLQFPRFLRPDLAGVTRFDLSQVYRAPRRPVVVPAERWPRAARERMANPLSYRFVGSSPASPTTLKII